MDSEHRPRLSIDVSQEQFFRMQKLIPWGVKTQLFNTLIDDLLDMCEKHGSGVVIGGFLQRAITLEGIYKFSKKG